jgi:hypothetical protein
MTEDKEAFLERWSRRKLEHVQDQPAPLEKANEQGEEPAAALPPVAELTPDSDFTPFMNPKVDGETRRAALKKLFADARYNVPDPFEAYAGDWTAGEPIPLEMLKRLNHAKKLLFDEPEKKIEAAAAAAPQGEEDSKDPVGTQDT